MEELSSRGEDGRVFKMKGINRVPPQLEFGAWYHNSKGRGCCSLWPRYLARRQKGKENTPANRQKKKEVNKVKSHLG